MRSSLLSSSRSRETDEGASRTDHFYPALQWLLEKDQGWMQSISKNFFVGENDWTGQVRSTPYLSSHAVS